MSAALGVIAAVPLTGFSRALLQVEVFLVTADVGVTDRDARAAPVLCAEVKGGSTLSNRT